MIHEHQIALGIVPASDDERNAVIERQIGSVDGSEIRKILEESGYRTLGSKGGRRQPVRSADQ